MSNQNEPSFYEELGKVFIFVLIIGSLFEVGLLVFAYINADEVECNLLWCTFTSGESFEVHNSYSNITQSVTSTSQCYINGEETNCSEIEKYTNKFKEWKR